MEINVFDLIQKIMPAILGILFIGVGLELKLSQFLEHVRSPRPIFIGLGLQMLMLPLIAGTVAQLFNFSNSESIGLMVLAAAPGGITAILFTRLCSGEVSLNISLTVINSALAAISIPLIVSGYTFLIFDQSIDLPSIAKQVLGIIAIVVLPLGVGIALSRRWPQLDQKLKAPISWLATLSLVSLFGIGIIKEGANLFGTSAGLTVGVAVFVIVNFLFSFLVTKMFGLPKGQIKAITFEVGIQNGTLALFLLMADSEISASVVPVGIYLIFMYLIGSLVAFAFKSQIQEKT